MYCEVRSNDVLNRFVYQPEQAIGHWDLRPAMEGDDDLTSRSSTERRSDVTRRRTNRRRIVLAKKSSIPSTLSIADARRVKKLRPPLNTGASCTSEI